MLHWASAWGASITTPELVEGDAGERQEAVLDGGDDLAGDVEAGVGEQIVGLVGAAGGGVLDGQGREIGRAREDGVRGA